MNHPENDEGGKTMQANLTRPRIPGTRLLFSILLLVLLLCWLSIPVIASDMVEISVEVTEVNNDKANSLGIKWVDTVLATETSIPAIFEVGDMARTTAITAELKVLVQKGAAKILSKPKLVTRSGTSARFLVGGEVPIVSSGVGGGTIEWKSFGIMCEISPRIVDVDFIDFSLTTEVSRLDWTNQVNGNPALMIREATSNARVRSGQTIALAGMVETSKQEHTAGIPLLSEIPVAGVLFGRKSFIDNKNTVLIFVTPRIID
ncbi:MAG: type II and III secretion system protein family protein [Endomicrobiales bacterium]